jgi:tRNA A37 threonylcarbamoyladenosine biosynthesis protein TsaE
MARMTPEDRARLDVFKDVKVKHPRLEEVDRLVSQMIEEHAGATHLLLYGPSGVGKSTVMKRLTERFIAAEPNRAIVPVVWVEARPSDTGVYARLDYYRQVLSGLREHAAVKDHLMHLALTAPPSRKRLEAVEWLEMREAVEYALERLQVKAVVIDEAQHLMQVTTPLRPVDQLDWLKSMTNRTQVLHVLVGPYDLFDLRNLSGQAARRGRDIHFPRYHLSRTAERQEFVGALRYLLEHVPLACDVDSLLPHWRWFAEWSIGCVGILRDWLVDTVAALLAEGERALTLEALSAHALEAGQRVRLEIEARTGERQVEDGKAHSQQQLEALLAPPGRGQSASAQTSASGSRMPSAPLMPPHESAIRPPSKRSTAKHRIGRAPERDPVGTSVQAAPANTCAFKGRIELVPAAMREVGVTKAECPECTTRRSLPLRGETVSFPSHPKRKTRIAPREARWVKRGTAWEVVDS